MNKRLVTLFLCLIFIFTLTSCGQKDTALEAYQPESAEKVQILNDDKANANEKLYGDIRIADVEKFFTEKGYPPFLDIDNGAGRKSMHPNGSVIYLYSSDKNLVDGITYRYFVNYDGFDNTVLAIGINEIANVIGLVLNREVSIDERKNIRQVYSDLLASGNSGDQKTIILSGISFYFSIEPLSQTLMCSYLTK